MTLPMRISLPARRLRLLRAQRRRREDSCEDEGYRKRSLSFCLHQHRHKRRRLAGAPPERAEFIAQANAGKMKC
ncbi:hypothetical protein ABIF15_001706 [Bradyrhizobium elkanii]